MKLIIFSVLVFITRTFAFSQINLDLGLGAHYTFDTGLTDASSFGVTGTNFGAAQVNGLDNATNGAYLFNSGSQSYINFGNNNRDVTNVVTVSLWIKTTTSQEQMVLAKYNYGVDKGYELVVENGKMKFTGRDGSGIFRHSGLSTAIVNDGDWHHVVGVVNQNTWEIWVDCNLESSSTYTVTSPDISNNEPLVAGMWHSGDGAGNYYYYDGAIDELRIYNRILTSDEMDSLCTRPYSLGFDSNNINSKIDFDLSPNPTTGKFFITNDNFESIRIFDIHGKLVHTEIRSDQQIIDFDISDKKPGIYIVEIRTIYHEVFRVKLVKS